MRAACVDDGFSSNGCRAINIYIPCNAQKGVEIAIDCGGGGDHWECWPL